MDPNQQISDGNGADYIEGSNSGMGLNLKAKRTFLSPKDQISVPNQFNLFDLHYDTTHPSKPLIGYTLSLKLDSDRNELEMMTTDEERSQYLQALLELEAEKYKLTNQYFIENLNTSKKINSKNKKVNFKDIVIKFMVPALNSKFSPKMNDFDKKSNLEIEKENANIDDEILETENPSTAEENYHTLTGFRILLKHQLDIEILRGGVHEEVELSKDILVELLSDIILKGDENLSQTIEGLVFRHKALNDIYNQEITLLKMLEQNPERVFKKFETLNTESD
jgi:hypothetical protein